jgi:pullulanase
MTIQDLLSLKRTHFVLWRLKTPVPPPVLVIGRFQPGNPSTFVGEQRFTLKVHPAHGDLWVIPSTDCKLTEGTVYHYWFEVNDTRRAEGARIQITDPTATSVDWRLLGPRLAAPYTEDDRYPAGVIKFSKKELVPCDPGGETGDWTDDPDPKNLPPNNRLVIYELPTAWARIGADGLRERGVGTFRDTLALVQEGAAGANFADLDAVAAPRSYLKELGVNALELLPPADSIYQREWGYGTTNFFAPDFELGFPAGHASPTANQDLTALVSACHQKGIRFFTDVVMAFAKQHPYERAALEEFFIEDPGGNQSDPDALTSTRSWGGREVRNGFGSALFRYARFVLGYDPVSGDEAMMSPAQQLMKTYLTHWMQHFRIDGLRLDSVENVYHWQFIQEFKDLARKLWKTRFGGTESAADERFLVVGEELSEPLDLLRQQRLDGLWHINFRNFIRAALVGRNASAEPSFEWTVRKAIDCRYFGYSDLAQAIIYLTSHDVEGFGAERLYNYLTANGITDAERRIKLAFACLLTAVGIPMILAGDEFADEHDRFDQNGNVTQDGGKQVDPVNYSRLSDDWRQRVKEYASRLIKLRTTYDALAVNETEFIHVDFEDGKRVVVWQRGRPETKRCVVVVANFSDFTTANPTSPNAEYRVPNWPATPGGMQWQEITQQRTVSPEWVGREPIYSWEAKVYALK